MQSVIVTGASGNLGRAVVQKFLEEKWQVTGTVIPGDDVDLDITNNSFEKVIADLMSEEASIQTIQTVIQQQGKINAAVLTVGGFAMGSIAETKTTDITKQYKLNFETAYNIARPVFMQMMKQGSGRLFLIGSQPGKDMQSSKGMVAYGLSKSLIFRLAELMNEEANGTDVIVCVVIPSTIDTPQNRKSMPDANFSKWITPQKLADLIYSNCMATENVKQIIEV
ncbi:MAG: SDR family NAD(P)-dependent oxidoreductase [Chitinophagaceae bacterium]|nr:SDR family NAD(P)-dependent oxidoreductase [Chitinophagaceae bacterium]